MKEIMSIFSIFVFFFGVFLLLVKMFLSKRSDGVLIAKENSMSTFAVLIPARDESRVIRGILSSIKNQTKKPRMEDVYVIVEDINDKSVSISKTFGASVIVRKDLTLRRKGYALDEAIKEILSKNKKYDAYFIMDADNILDSNYFLEMEKSYKQGYDIAISYRGAKNGNDSIMAACSTLTFSMINTIGNKKRKKKNQAMTISGTGFYIEGSWIEKWGGYPFHSLTEDYELTLYMILHGLTSTYNENAYFYDEQPIDYKTTVRQRTRWIRGYIDARRTYIPRLRRKWKESKNPSILSALIGVWPYLFMIIGMFLSLIMAIVNSNEISRFFPFLGMIIFIIYLCLAVFTFLMLCEEKEKLGLSFRSKVMAVLFNPIFLATYIHCAIRALFSRNLEWKKIEHIR